MWYYFFTWRPLGSVNDLLHTSRILFLLQILDSSWLLDSSGVSPMSMVVGFFNLKGKKMCTWSCTDYWHPKYHFHILKSKCHQLCKISRGKIGMKYLQLWLGFPSPIFLSSGMKSLILQGFPMEKFGKEHENLTL